MKPIDVKNLLEVVREREAECSSRNLYSNEESAIYLQAYQEAHRIAGNKSNLAFRAELLRQFSLMMPVVSEKHSPFHGSRRFDIRIPMREEATKHFAKLAHGHSIIDWETLLHYGPQKLENDILAMADSDCKEAFLTAIQSFRYYIRRHKDCKELADRPPVNFYEALQIIWFGQIFLRAEGASAGISFGRMDEYLLPFVTDCSDETIISLLIAWFAKCCEGDESQNVTLGEASSDRLTILFLKALNSCQLWQPSLSIRISSNISETVWQKALDLTLSGSGQPSYFNSPVVMEALQNLGIPEPKLFSWGSVGCYEPTIPAESAPFTVAAAVSLPDILMNFLKENTTEIADFDTFIKMFLDYFRNFDWAKCLGNCKDYLRNFSATPFESLMIKDCISKSRYLSDCGAKYNTLGVNMLGIGTILDSLLVIKHAVFTKRIVTLTELTKQTLNNSPIKFENCPFFGDSNQETEKFVTFVSEEICKYLLTIVLHDGTRLAPSYFLFGADIMTDVQATPDGRKFGERVSYGCMPSERHPIVQTERLRAAALIPHNMTPNGSPAMVSVAKNLLSADRLKGLIQGYFALGGSHLHFNMQDKETLIEAQKYPESHSDLTVRVSGYSAHFIRLAPRWQQALIDRIDNEIENK